jgi:hypothetical protein
MIIDEGLINYNSDDVNKSLKNHYTIFLNTAICIDKIFLNIVVMMRAIYIDQIKLLFIICKKIINYIICI